MTEKNIISEHQEQKIFVSWFELAYPDKLIFAIPNGGKRNIVTAAKLKAEGVKAGIPDLFIPEHNVWIEMKRKSKASLSESQKTMIEKLKNCGHVVLVCYGCDDAILQVTNYLKTKTK